MTQQLYVVLGTSERGDDYFYGIFDREPSEQHLAAMIEATSPSEIVDEGDGVLFSCIRPQVHGPYTVSALPAPSASHLEYP